LFCIAGGLSFASGYLVLSGGCVCLLDVLQLLDTLQRLHKSFKDKKTVRVLLRGRELLCVLPASILNDILMASVLCHVLMAS